VLEQREDTNFNKTVEFNWNSKNFVVPNDLQSLAKTYGGLAFEFLLPEVNSKFRVFRTKEKGFYVIFNADSLLAIISGDGKVVSYKGSELVTEKNRVTGIGYTNYDKGYLEVQGASLKRICLNGELVGRLGSPSIFEWVSNCITSKNFTKPEFWDGLRFNSTKLDMDIALALLISKVASFND